MKHHEVRNLYPGLKKLVPEQLDGLIPFWKEKGLDSHAAAIAAQIEFMARNKNKSSNIQSHIAEVPFHLDYNNRINLGEWDEKYYDMMRAVVPYLPEHRRNCWGASCEDLVGVMDHQRGEDNPFSFNYATESAWAVHGR